MSKPVIFISHISEEVRLAVIFEQHMAADFLNLIEVFVFSDTEIISAGKNWLTSIDTALRNACIELILCSKASIKRPWINFEDGAGWMSGIPVVPVCQTELRPRDLPMPFSVLQALEANQESSLREIYELVAKKLESEVPYPDFPEIIKEVQSFEGAYAGPLKETIKGDTNRKDIVSKRIKEHLEARKPEWRTMERIANRSGVLESEAQELLVQDSAIEFDKGRAGKLITRIKSRQQTQPGDSKLVQLAKKIFTSWSPYNLAIRSLV